MMLSEKVRDNLRIVAFSVVGSLVTTYFTCVPCRENIPNYLIVTFFSACLWIALWMGNGNLTHYLSQHISWVQFPIRRLVIGVASTVAYTVGVVLIIVEAWEYFLQVDIGNTWYVVSYSLVITFLISLFLHGREFLIQWRKSAIEAEQFQKESVRAQYESLRNQVNPHFLFNSLNALTNLVYEDQDKAVRFIKQLSEVYRYVLETRDREVVPLRDELKFLDSYLFLQQIRYGNKLQITVNLSDIQAAVPPLALQMLIENAIKHNVISEEDPLEIRMFAETGFLVVENNLHRKNVLPGESAGLGLDNIRRRYGFLDARAMSATECDGKFVVKLPLLNLPA
jgi:LytS/YehU family sensor histidine kinase